MTGVGRIYRWGLRRKIHESRIHTLWLLVVWSLENNIVGLFPLDVDKAVYWIGELVVREVREKRTVSKEEAYAHFDRLYMEVVG